MKIRFTALLFSAVLLAGSGQALAQGQMNAVGAGLGLNPIGHVLTVDYERLLNPHVSVGVRLGMVDYEWKDEPYIENGDGTGVDITARYYFRGQGFQGPYVGASIGRWSGDYTWVEGSGRGAGSWDATNVTATVGWVFQMTPNFSLDPAILIGQFMSDSKPTTGTTRESELGFFAAVMIRAVFTF